VIEEHSCPGASNEIAPPPPVVVPSIDPPPAPALLENQIGGDNPLDEVEQIPRPDVVPAHPALLALSEIAVAELLDVWQREHVANLGNPARYAISVQHWLEFRAEIIVAPPFVRDVDAKEKSKPRELIYTYEQIAAILDAAASRPDRHHLFLYILIQLSTWAERGDPRSSCPSASGPFDPFSGPGPPAEFEAPFDRPDRTDPGAVADGTPGQGHRLSGGDRRASSQAWRPDAFRA